MRIACISSEKVTVLDYFVQLNMNGEPSELSVSTNQRTIERNMNLHTILEPLSLLDPTLLDVLQILKRSLRATSSDKTSSTVFIADVQESGIEKRFEKTLRDTTSPRDMIMDLEKLSNENAVFRIVLFSASMSELVDCSYAWRTLDVLGYFYNLSPHMLLPHAREYGRRRHLPSDKNLHKTLPSAHRVACLVTRGLTFSAQVCFRQGPKDPKTCEL
jgi:hypothetical protein